MAWVMCDAFEDAAAIPLDVGEHDSMGDAGRLTRLRRQERQWFAWLTILHERLGKEDSPLLAESRTVLEIAKKRWLEAREALRTAVLNDGPGPEINPQSMPKTASCIGRRES